MNVFSLRTVIDDILLIVRNNNISESEDFSRDQLRSWILAYKAYLSKKQHDKDEQEGLSDTVDDTLCTTIGPLALQDEKKNECCVQSKRTVKKIPQLLGNSADDIIQVVDETGCVYQSMSQSRRHYHFFRRYTSAEPCFYYEGGYIYIEGKCLDDIREIYLTANFIESGTNDQDGTEDEVEIPGWMIPDIKKAIMDNELSFLVKRPSDDSNNSALSSVKPHGPQDKEK